MMARLCCLLLLVSYFSVAVHGMIAETPSRDRIHIAIVGAGTGGLFAAISLSKKFGDTVAISLFEKQANFDEERGVELAIGPAAQMAMLDVDMDLKKLRALGYRIEFGVKVRDSAFHPVHDVGDALTTDLRDFLDVPEDQVRYRLHGYSLKRGLFMEYLHEELGRINSEATIAWNARVETIDVQTSQRLQLGFADGTTREFDLVIGADGVHSAVRNLFFDKEPPIHVGANIAYGVIPHGLESHDEHQFYIVMGERFTTVSARFRERDAVSLSTWWAMIFPDSLYTGDDKHTAFWEARTNALAIRNIAYDIVDDVNDPFVHGMLKQTPDSGFKYAGKFLERKVSDLEYWGKQNVVLIGDAVHAMMPWAGAGVAMAFEDVAVLLNLFYDAKLMQSRKQFDAALASGELAAIYQKYKSARYDRVSYFQTLTRQICPRGVLSKSEFHADGVDINARYGNHRSLSSSPIFSRLGEEKFLTKAARQDFFDNQSAISEGAFLTQQ